MWLKFRIFRDSVLLIKKLDIVFSAIKHMLDFFTVLLPRLYGLPPVKLNSERRWSMVKTAFRPPPATSFSPLLAAESVVWRMPLKNSSDREVHHSLFLLALV